MKSICRFKTLKALLFALPILFVFLACGQEKGLDKVEYPLYQNNNTQILDVAAVEITDSVTKVVFDVYYIPHYWIKMACDSYLFAEGKKYFAVGAEGIQLDSLFWMPDSGKATFSLLFEPLPKGTPTFDFFEGDCERCFRIFGIDMTGKKYYSELASPEMMKVVKCDTIPDPVFATASTTIEIQVLNYKPEFGWKVSLMPNNIWIYEEELTADLDSTGCATFNILQSGTVFCDILLGENVSTRAGGSNVEAKFWVAPGESIKIQVEPYSFYENVTMAEYFRKQSTANEPKGFVQLNTNGTYAALNAAYNTYRSRMDYFFVRGIDFLWNKVKYDATPSELADGLICYYNERSKEICESDKEPILKELALLSAKQEIIYALCDNDMLRRRSYSQGGRNDSREYPGGFEKLSLEDIKRVTSLFDINDHKLLMGIELRDFLFGFYDFENYVEVAGKDDQMFSEMRQSMSFIRESMDAQLKEEHFKCLQDSGFIFALDACKKIQQSVLDDLEQKKGKYKIEETPDVAPEKLFDAIVSPYKGKVVFVDFWNTWCSTCRQGIQEMKSLKKQMADNPDVVWLYIADETSPLATYKSMIADIDGVHYRLNMEQISELCKKFKINDIPSYVLVDKQGKATLRNEIRNPQVLSEILSEELAK